MTMTMMIITLMLMMTMTMVMMMMMMMGEVVIPSSPLAWDACVGLLIHTQDPSLPMHLYSACLTCQL